MDDKITSNIENPNHQISLYILLVEDDLVVQRVHYTMLIRLGYKVDIASDGIKALEMYKNGNYNIILLDCGLPDISGIDVCKCIRQLEQQKGIAPIPVVMVSAYFKDDLADECRLAGVNEFATKPLRSQELNMLLRKYVA